MKPLKIQTKAYFWILMTMKWILRHQTEASQCHKSPSEYEIQARQVQFIDTPTLRSFATYAERAPPENNNNNKKQQKKKTLHLHHSQLHYATHDHYNRWSCVWTHDPSSRTHDNYHEVQARLILSRPRQKLLQYSVASLLNN